MYRGQRLEPETGTGKALAGPRADRPYGNIVYRASWSSRHYTLIVTFLGAADMPGVQSLLVLVSSSVPALWRPWMPLPGDAELTRTGSPVS